MSLKLLADGQIVGPFSTSAYLGAQIDLAADQCTVYFALTHGPRGEPISQINRFNICQGTALPPLTAAGPPSGPGIRLLPSGEILMASGATLASLTTDDPIIGISVMGEPRAAFAEPAAIPLFSQATAILLLAAFAGVGLFALPRL